MSVSIGGSDTDNAGAGSIITIGSVNAPVIKVASSLIKGPFEDVIFPCSNSVGFTARTGSGISEALKNEFGFNLNLPLLRRPARYSLWIFQ